MRARVWARLVSAEAVVSLRRNKLRSGLAVLGVAAAVATVTVMIALGQAGIEAAEHELAQLGDNLVWIEAGTRNASGVRTGSHGMTNLTEHDAHAIREQVPLIAEVSEQVDGGLVVVYGGRNWTTRWRGVAPAFQRIKSWPVAEGAFFSDDDTERAALVMVIGQTVRRELFGDGPAIGEQLRVGTLSFEVIGVLAAKGASSTGQDQDDTTIVPWTTARKRLLGKDVTWLDDILCSAVSPDAIARAGTSVAALLRDRHHLAPGTDDDFNIRHPEDVLKARIRSREAIANLFLAIASLSMIVSGIGVMNVMFASVSQRVRELGIRAAVGASPLALRVQILAEATLLTAVGAVLGAGLTALAAWMLERHGWVVDVAPRTILECSLGALAVGLVSGYSPANRAARMDPIEALRSE